MSRVVKHIGINVHVPIYYNTRRANHLDPAIRKGPFSVTATRDEQLVWIIIFLRWQLVGKLHHRSVSSISVRYQRPRLYWDARDATTYRRDLQNTYTNQLFIASCCHCRSFPISISRWLPPIMLLRVLNILISQPTVVSRCSRRDNLSTSRDLQNIYTNQLFITSCCHRKGPFLIARSRWLRVLCYVYCQWPRLHRDARDGITYRLIAIFRIACTFSELCARLIICGVRVPLSIVGCRDRFRSHGLYIGQK